MSTCAFYDTVVFLLSLNRGDPAHGACRALLAIDSVTWTIALSAISRGEASIDEYLSQLEQQCALQGVEWREVAMDQISAAVKRNAGLKTRLTQAAMQSRDIKQAFAAGCAQAALLVTCDQDFFDPKGKRHKGRAGKADQGGLVARLLRDELGLRVCTPADACEALGCA